MIRLTAGEWECELRPAVGGAVAALSKRGLDILRPMPSESSAPLDAACFPLVPFCNRIGGGQFAFGAHSVALTPNHLPEPHALHGLGWHQAWELTESGPDFARLVHTHDGKTEWPWPYRSEQHIRLDHQGLEMSITITNLADEPAPAGLGLHPYFRRSGETVVRFTAEALLVCEPGLLPTGELAPADTLAAWSDGAALPAATVDHCHTGWNGQAIITDARGEVLLTASNAGYLHVYAPEDGSALCLEPVSHRPDARNTCPGDMSVLAPGETLSLSMRITA